MFSNRKAKEVLNHAEIQAVREFLEHDLSQFSARTLNQYAL